MGAPFIHLPPLPSIGKQLYTVLANTDPLNAARLLEKNTVARRENIVVSTQSAVVPLCLIEKLASKSKFTPQKKLF